MSRASDFGAFELNRIHPRPLSPSSYLLSFCALRNCRFRVALLPSLTPSRPPLHSSERFVPFISIFACKSITSTSFKISPPSSVPPSPLSSSSASPQTDDAFYPRQFSQCRRRPPSRFFYPICGWAPHRVAVGGCENEVLF